MKRRASIAAALGFAAVTGWAGPARSEEPAADPGKKPWSNETEFNLVFTEGNSNTETLGFKNTLVRHFTSAQFRLKLEALRSATSDDWYLQVDPGFTWEPGATLPPITSSLVKPPSELDAENYFVEGRYDREIRKSLNWHAGTSWDRNKDAGIVGRTIVFGGLGNMWWDRPEFRFQTSYGLSWTDREEEEPDPEKDESFAGARLAWRLLYKFNDNASYDNDSTFNVNLADVQDWSGEMTNSLSVSMNKWLSLRVSLRWLYNNEPALEDVDVTARVEIRDPDGVPGSGDEFYESVAQDGIEIALGEGSVRKEELDQIFKATLVVSF